MQPRLLETLSTIRGEPHASSFAASYLCAVALDLASYDPLNTFGPIGETARVYFGVIGAVVALVIVTPAPWPDTHRWIAAGISVATLIAVQVRIRETDRAIAGFAATAEMRARKSRTDTIELLHDRVKGEMRTILRRATALPVVDRELLDAIGNVNGFLHEMMELQGVSLDVTFDWPGLLIANMNMQLGRSGIEPALISFPETPMALKDRRIAQLVLQHLMSNVVKSDATVCRARVDRAADEYIAAMTDDGNPVDIRRWMRPGGGLRHLASKYSDHALSFEVSESDGMKTIKACWYASDPKGGYIVHE